VKILAYILLALGLIMMAFSRPSTDQPDFPVMFTGAVMGIVGVFLWSRLRQGIPILAVTDKDKTQLQEMCTEFAPRRFVGRLIGALGALIVMAAFYDVISSESPTPKWSTFLFMLVTGVGLVLVASWLLKQPRPRPRYWRTAISGIVCSGCSVLFFVCVVVVVRTPKEHIPRWLWGVIGLLIVVGTFAAIACIHSGIMDALGAKLESSKDDKKPVA
jgi:hypothetical protein